MKAFTLLCTSLGLLLGSTASAQLDLPLSDVSLAYPGAPALTVQLGGTNRAILPTPFVLAGSFSNSALWICMDPLQTIFYNGSGEPFGSSLHYASQNPANFDKWNPGAPGLNSARLQNLADLFATYAPTRSNQLIGAALQLAVPEITNEFDGSPFSLTLGQFRAFDGGNVAAGAIISLAQSMLASLDDAGVQGKGNVQSLRFLIDGSYTNRNGTTPVQDLVGFVPVPEPSTYALAALGVLLPLIAFRLRRQRASALTS